MWLVPRVLKFCSTYIHWPLCLGLGLFESYQGSHSKDRPSGATTESEPFVKVDSLAISSVRVTRDLLPNEHAYPACLQESKIEFEHELKEAKTNFPSHSACTYVRVQCTRDRTPLYDVNPREPVAQSKLNSSVHPRVHRRTSA